MTNTDLVCELLAMQDIGVPVGGQTIVRATSDDLSQYASMSVGDLASLYCELFNEGHTGWMNYETWVVNLWMNNQRGQQDYWLEEARQCFAENSPDDLFTQAEKAAIALADRIKDEYEDAATEMLRHSNYETGPLADLLNGALGAVNWDEIARSWVEKMGEQAAYEKQVSDD